MGRFLAYRRAAQRGEMRVLERPDDPATFTPGFLPGIYGPDPVAWASPALAPLPVLVPYPHPFLPDEVFAGAPIVHMPVWKAWSSSCNQWDNACNETVALAILPASRVGYSTGARHSIRLVQNADGTPLGYLGYYQPGGSGNFLQTPFGKFIATEIAGGIVRVVVDVVGTIVTLGTGTSVIDAAGSAAGSAVSSGLPGAGTPLASSITSVIDGAVAATSTPLSAGATAVLGRVMDKTVVDSFFATAALVSTNLAGFDDLLVGLGSLLRAMASDMQSDPRAFQAQLAQRLAAINARLGPALAIARLVANAVPRGREGARPGHDDPRQRG